MFVGLTGYKMSRGIFNKHRKFNGVRTSPAGRLFFVSSLCNLPIKLLSIHHNSLRIFVWTLSVTR